MADRKIIYEVDVDTNGADDSIGNLSNEIDKTNTSLTDLKKQLKAAKDEAARFDEGSVGFIEATARAGALKDKINEVNEATAAFAGGSKMEVFGNTLGGVTNKLRDLDFSGAATSAKNLVAQSKGLTFKEGISGVKSLGSTFLSLGKALLLNPIFLIAAVIVGIGAAMYELKDKIKPIKLAFDAVGDALNYVIQLGKDFLDFVGLTTFAEDEAAQKTVDNKKKETEAVEARYDREIAIAKASGKNTAELEKKKLEATTASIDTQIKELERKRARDGFLSDEELKDYEELQKNKFKLTTEALAADAKAKADAKAAEEKAANEAYQAYLKLLEERKNADATLRVQILKQQNEAAVASLKAEEDKQKLILKQEYDAQVKSINQSKAFAKTKSEALLVAKNEFERKTTEIERKAEEEREKNRLAFAAKVVEDRLRIEDEVYQASEKAKELELKNLLDANKRLQETDGSTFAWRQEKLKEQRDLQFQIIKQTEKTESEALKKKRDALNIANMKLREDEMKALMEGGADRAVAELTATENFERRKNDIKRVYEEEGKQIVTESLRAQTDAENELTDKLRQMNQQRAQDRINIAQMGANSLSAINDLVTTLEDNAVKKGNKTQLEAAKAQFKRTKALNMVTAGINTAQAILQAIAQFGPPPSPLGIAGIASASVIGAAQIAAIAAKKFDGGESGGGASSSVSVGSFDNLAQKLGGSGSAPTVGNTSGQLFDPKVYVVESEITETQQRMARIRQKGTY